MTSFTRAIVLFTLAAVSSTIYYPLPYIGFIFFPFLIVDSITFLLLLISRVPLKELGLVWAGLWSIMLILGIYPYLGNRYFVPDVTVIILMSIIQLLTLMKIGIDAYNNAATGDEGP